LPAVQLSKRSLLLLVLAAAAVLVACSGGGSEPTPPQTVDKASATIGSTGGTVVTPSGAAGVQVPAGAFSQPVTVTVTQLTAPSTPGTGPLPTSLKQYPPYYEFTTSPAVAQFGDSVRVGVCQVTNPSDPLYAPEADHVRLKLAHTVGATIEILERVDVNDFLRCTNVTAGIRQSSGWRGALASIVTKAGNQLSPASAYAAHGGLGGKVKSFSPFGAVVDPCVGLPVFVIGTTVNGTIQSSDCNIPGLGFADLFTFSLPAQTILKVTASGSGINEFAIRATDRPADQNFVFDQDAPSSHYGVAPAGNYFIGVTDGPGAGGPYSLRIENTTIPDGCIEGPTSTGPIVFLFADVVLPGTITSNDCTGVQSNIFVDHYEIRLFAGLRYQIQALGSGLGLEVGVPNGQGGIDVIASQNNPNGSVGFTVSPPQTGIHIVNVLGAPPGKTGPYTLRITRVP
jgi:hypothetical protein